jgi:hypothetical protein
MSEKIKFIVHEYVMGSTVRKFYIQVYRESDTQYKTRTYPHIDVVGSTTKMNQKGIKVWPDDTEIIRMTRKEALDLMYVLWIEDYRI